MTGSLTNSLVLAHDVGSNKTTIKYDNSTVLCKCLRPPENTIKCCLSQKYQSHLFIQKKHYCQIYRHEHSCSLVFDDNNQYMIKL